MRKKNQAFPVNGAEFYLLKACLAQDRETLQLNLKKWKAEQDLDLIDLASYRLIPLLQKQITGFKVEDPNLPIYKGIYRKCWMSNKRLFYEAVKLSGELSSRGIPVVILKGIALSVLYYKDSGVRPMDDADIWVPFDKIQEALEVLRA